MIDTGNNSAGNGGEGYFSGSLVDAPVVIYMPINIAIAGYNSTADANQSNMVQIDQSATQIAGMGGNGGDGNASIGGNVPTSGFGSGGHESGAISSGGNQAGNGGDGFFYGSIIHASFVLYDPINIAVAGYNSTAHADQTNNVDINQSAVQMAGLGGNGGNGNAAVGGNVGNFSSAFEFASNAINTGNNDTGNGGDGHFSGSLVDSPVVIYMPINIAIAGYNSTADANQSNSVKFDQSATQIAGVGGEGGSNNMSIGGNASASGFGNDYSHGWLDPAVILSGGNQAGNGGDGLFHGSIVHASFALYDPINIAVAGYNSTANADQMNNVDINQSAVQMAGIGGNGGNGNAALGGNVGIFSSGFGSDAINTGTNEAGNGGSGHFFGNLIDQSIATYAPVNIAMAGYISTAVAHQINSMHLDQSAIQIAGIGGDGGHGNVAMGGDFGMHLLPDHHLLLG